MAQTVGRWPLPLRSGFEPRSLHEMYGERNDTGSIILQMLQIHLLNLLPMLQN